MFLDSFWQVKLQTNPQNSLQSTAYVTLSSNLGLNRKAGYLFQPLSSGSEPSLEINQFSAKAAKDDTLQI